MKNFFWVITILSCLVGGLFLVSAFFSTQAPQQAASAAMACAFAIIPYVLARAAEKVSGNRTEEQNERIISALKRISEPQSIESKAAKYDALKAENQFQS
ncbi:MAG TPA: hypothetical protein VD927_12390 [Chryseosolibacter sp.]|nr:hypothetical protein [Chryseosolibacter sp.]